MDFSAIDYSDPASVFAALGGGDGTGLPIPKIISAREVRAEARNRSKRLFADRDALKAILARHETTIHKRWSKKTKNQRVEILLRAWPGMASTHRPDFAALSKESEGQRRAGTRFRDSFLWPYINLQDLSKTKTLLLFLQARSRNDPDAFAMADENAAHIGIVSGAIVPAFLNEYVMMFTNRKTAERYGELISWDDEDDAFQWLHSGKGLHPGQGLMVLEMQERVMRFLVDCCKAILHDIPGESLVSDEYPLQPMPAIEVETVNGFASLAVLAAEAPYRLPSGLDFTRLESLLEAKVSAAEDHIWALREDPSYFAGALLEMKEHRQEMIKDTNGRDHPLLTSNREEIFWSRVIGNVITNAYLGLEVWSELHCQIKEVHELYKKHAHAITIDEDLPEEYLAALLRFQHYLDQATKGPMGQLKHDAVASPPLRAYFMRDPPPDETSTMIGIRQKPGLKLDKVQSELIWLLKMLWEDGQELFLSGLTRVVDELERLIQMEPKAKDMVSAHIARVIGDLSIATEGLRQIKIYQPWAQTFEEALVDREDGIKKEFAWRTKQWSAFLGGATSGPFGAKIVRLGEPIERKFYYPVDKRRSKENVEHMRTAERNLDAFWLAVDQNVDRNAKYGLDRTALQKLLSQSRTLQRTPEWVEPTKQTPVNSIECLEKPLSTLYFDREHRTEKTIDRSSVNTKAGGKNKTRGRPTPGLSEQTNGSIPSDVPDDPQPTFHLDARALKVFRTLFYTPSADATPGVIPWTDFLHAMVSTGFRPEKLYGSVWQFHPTQLDVERSIQFHEPHPVAKLPYLVARRFGRRLERAYGWRAGMFKLKEKEAE